MQVEYESLDLIGDASVLRDKLFYSFNILGFFLLFLVFANRKIPDLPFEDFREQGVEDCFNKPNHQLQNVLLSIQFSSVLLIDLEFIHKYFQSVIDKVVKFMVVFLFYCASLDGNVK